MRLYQIIGFIGLAFGLGACKEGSSDNFVGGQRYEIVGLRGTVTNVQQLCTGMEHLCDPLSTEVTIDIGIGGGCDSFLSVEFTVDRANKQVQVIAQGLKNVTPGIACTAQYSWVTKRLRLTNLTPPFDISYQNTGWVSFIQDDSTWHEYQMIE